MRYSHTHSNDVTNCVRKNDETALSNQRASQSVASWIRTKDTRPKGNLSFVVELVESFEHVNPRPSMSVEGNIPFTMKRMKGVETLEERNSPSIV